MGMHAPCITQSKIPVLVPTEEHTRDGVDSVEKLSNVTQMVSVKDGFNWATKW
jgi:hypothetical protein